MKSTSRLERGQDRGDVLALEAGAGDLPDADAELVAHDLRERRLPQSRRSGEQQMVERLAARLRCGERDLELLLDALLPDEVGERPWPQRPLDLLLCVAEDGREELAHAAIRSAARTCSSIGSEGSTSERTRSASSSDQPSSTKASRAARS